jgi:hypothetical protein
MVIPVEPRVRGHIAGARAAPAWPRLVCGLAAAARSRGCSPRRVELPDRPDPPLSSPAAAAIPRPCAATALPEVAPYCCLGISSALCTSTPLSSFLRARGFAPFPRCALMAMSTVALPFMALRPRSVMDACRLSVVVTLVSPGRVGRVPPNRGRVEL